MEQLSFDELLKTEMQESEKNKPWFLQISSASLVRFNVVSISNFYADRGKSNLLLITLCHNIKQQLSSILPPIYPHELFLEIKKVPFRGNQLLQIPSLQHLQ